MLSLFIILSIVVTGPKVAKTAVASPARVENRTPLPGTSKNIEIVFLGRCEDFFRYYKDTETHPARDANPDPSRYCRKIWEAFYKAWAFKNICTVTREAYNDFFKLTGSNLKILDKVLFWSGAQKLASQYADNGKRAFSLADTLTGYLVTDLNWCGDSSKGSTTGINYVNCPRCRTASDDTTTKEGFEVFWAYASELLAKRAAGEVRHLVVGTGKDPSGRPKPAFSVATFFYNYELPNMDPRQVKKIRVLLVNDPKLITLDGEHCGSGSLLLLQNEVKAKGQRDGKEIPFECVENPPELLCLLAN